MTLELDERRAKVLKTWLEDYAEWLSGTANCIPDYACREDRKEAARLAKRAAAVRRFVSRHWPSDHVTVSVRTKTMTRS